MRAPSELSAPGKAYVAGEYSVLERGEPALVLAVEVRLHVALRALSGSAVELTHAPTGASLRGEHGSRGSGADVAACASRGLIEARSASAWASVDDLARLPARDLLRMPSLEV